MRQFNARHQPSPLPPPSLSIRERFFYENEGGRDFTSHPSRDRIENNNFAILKFFVHVFLPIPPIVGRMEMREFYGSFNGSSWNAEY